MAFTATALPTTAGGAFTFVWNACSDNDTVPTSRPATGSTRLYDTIGNYLQMVLNAIYGSGDYPWKTAIGAAFSTVAGQQYIAMPADWVRTYTPWLYTAAKNYRLRIETDYNHFQQLMQGTAQPPRGLPLVGCVVYEPTTAKGYIMVFDRVPDQVYPFLLDYIRQAPPLTTDSASPLIPQDWIGLWLTGTIYWVKKIIDGVEAAEKWRQGLPPYIQNMQQPPGDTFDGRSVLWENTADARRIALPAGIIVNGQF